MAIYNEEKQLHASWTLIPGGLTYHKEISYSSSHGLNLKHFLRVRDLGNKKKLRNDLSKVKQ